MMDIQTLLMLLGSGGQPQGQSLGGGTSFSNVAPPAPLSGLNFAEQAFSGATGAPGGAPSGRGLVPGIQPGPGLEDMLSQVGTGGEEAGAGNLASLLTPIGAGIGTGLSPFGQAPGQDFVAGQRGPSPGQGPQGFIAGQSSGRLDSLRTIQQALGLLQKSGLFQTLLGQEPSLGVRGETGGVSLSDTLRGTAGLPLESLQPGEMEQAFASGQGGLPPAFGEEFAGPPSENFGIGGAPGGVTPQVGTPSGGVPLGQQLSGGLGAAIGGLGLSQGLMSGNVPQSVGGGLQLGGGLANLGGYGGVGGAAGGLGGLLNLIEGSRGGNPQQAIQGGLGTYGGLSSLAPETFPGIASLLSGGAGAGLGGASGLAATEAGIGLGAGEALGGGAAAGVGSAAAGTGVGLAALFLTEIIDAFLSHDKPAGYSKMIGQQRAGEAAATSQAAQGSQFWNTIYDQAMKGGLTDPTQLRQLGTSLLGTSNVRGLEPGFATNPGYTVPTNQARANAMNIERMLLTQGIPGIANLPSYGYADPKAPIGPGGFESYVPGMGARPPDPTYNDWLGRMLLGIGPQKAWNYGDIPSVTNAFGPDWGGGG